MKKCLLASMLLMLISFSLFIGPSEEMAHHSFKPIDEPAISSVYKIASSDVITESVQTIIPKWQTDFLFPSTDDLQILKEKLNPNIFMNHLFHPREIAGFICAVQHQSNYLS